MTNNGMNRRRFILRAGCLCLCSGVGTIHAKQLQENVSGCLPTGSQSDAILQKNVSIGALGKKTSPSSITQDDISRTTGDRDRDLVFDAALQNLAKAFNIYPGFGFYDDSDGENAYAMPRVIIAGTEGTVIFGKRLFRTMLRMDPTGGSVMWTAAHEFAHVWAYKNGTINRLKANQPTVKRAELHADYMAGVYLGMQKTKNSSVRLWRSGEDIWNSGDTAYNSRNHHGTPAERLAAAEAGFKRSYFDGRTPRDAFEDGLDYVFRI
jgi:hypothetical protein